MPDDVPLKNEARGTKKKTASYCVSQHSFCVNRAAAKAKKKTERNIRATVTYVEVVLKRSHDVGLRSDGRKRERD